MVGDQGEDNFDDAFSPEFPLSDNFQKKPSVGKIPFRGPRGSAPMFLSICCEETKVFPGQHNISPC